MHVLVGATGFLGGAVAEEMVKRQLPVRCLVRKDADTAHLQMPPSPLEASCEHEELLHHSQ